MYSPSEEHLAPIESLLCSVQCDSSCDSSHSATMQGVHRNESQNGMVHLREPRALQTIRDLFLTAVLAAVVHRLSPVLLLRSGDVEQVLDESVRK